MLDQKVEQYQKLKTEQPVAYAAMLDQKIEQYQQLKTEQPVAYAARLNAAAESRKKKKKKQETACPGSVHGRLQPCTECKSIWCHSK
jgi:hypothetical protein